MPENHSPGGSAASLPPPPPVPAPPPPPPPGDMELPPAEAPKPAIVGGPSLAQDGHIRRPLPTVKSPSRSFLQQAAAATAEAPQSAEEAKAFLVRQNREVLARLKFVTDFFTEEGAPEGANPTKSSDFLTFVRDHLSYLNMGYVVYGRVPARPEQAGMSEPPLPPDQAIADIPVSPTASTEGLDPALSAHPAVLEALEAGLDLTSDAGEFSDDQV